MEIRLEKAAFKSWLEANRGNAVGIAYSISNCAFARYLKEQGAIEASVGDQHFEYLVGTDDGPTIKYERTPQWLAAFIHSFDRGGLHGQTGNFALECLFRAEQVLEKQAQAITFTHINPDIQERMNEIAERFWGEYATG